MNNRILLAAAMLSLTACASVSVPSPDPLAATQIVPGVSTRAEVDELLGKPAYSFGPTAATPAEVAYEYKDVWGYDEALWVTYDEKGTVASTYSERLEDR